MMSEASSRFAVSRWIGTTSTTGPNSTALGNCYTKSARACPASMASMTIPMRDGDPGASRPFFVGSINNPKSRCQIFERSHTQNAEP